MTSMMDIVADATSAATNGWKRARQAAFGSAGPIPVSSDRDALVRLIEADIIPRLLAGRKAEGTAEGSVLPNYLVPRFARALIDDDAAALQAEVDALHDAGHTAQRLMEFLVAPAARLLGDWWLADEIDFVDVTLGVWRCQTLVHALSAREPGAGLPSVMQRHALILPAPGEQHVLGAMMVEHGFRRAGWATRSGPALDENALLTLVAQDDFDVIGLSAGSQRVLASLPRTIASVRRAVKQPLLIIVGGAAVNGEAAVARRVGADAAARDAAHAVALAEQFLIGRLPVRAAAEGA